ncbi:MAG: hypothetical protein GX490_00085 [Bacilli bacterium]|nr:hypothetical protein [Bacilli bacterium]
MNFKALRDQILANVDQYSTEESKIVIVKLLDFLVDLDEKRSTLEKENQILLTEKIDWENHAKVSTDVYEKQAADILDKAKQEADEIIINAKKQAEKIEQEAYGKGNEILTDYLNQVEGVIKNLKDKDEELKRYRSHILTIFRKTIFRFADTNYFIFRNDNEDFREMLQFFETDDALQKLCDDIIKSLSEDPKYLEIVKEVEEKTDYDLEELLKDETIKIDDKAKEEVNEETPQEETQEVEEEQVEVPTARKFLEVFNQLKYKK